jgi:hypothetical protein
LVGVHDLGMGLASFREGVAALEGDPQFDDLYTAAHARLVRVDPFADLAALDQAAHEQTISDLLRLRHAEQAERLVTTAFRTSDGEPFYLLGDAALRHTFGSLIGRIARSHWWDVSELRCFEVPLGSCVDGIGEIDVASMFEVYSVSYAARAVPIATSGAVSTEHGMVLLANTPEDAPSLRRVAAATTTCASGGVFVSDLSAARQCGAARSL